VYINIMSLCAFQNISVGDGYRKSGILLIALK
jgi:hypothetical protein